jgi:PAS domain S-box-containing protein
MIFDQDGAVAHKILARTGMPSEKAEAVVADVLSQGLAGLVVEQREGYVIDDVLSDDRWINFPDDDLIGGAALSVPLLRHEQVIGVITLRHPEQGHFTDDHMVLLTSIGDQASIAILNARLFHSVQAERAKMEAILNDAGDAILVIDWHGDVLLMNTVARRAFGVSDEQNLAYRRLADLVQNSALLALWQHREDTEHSLTKEIPLPDGRTFHASLTNIPDVGFVIVMQDITHLKEIDRMKDDFVSAVSHDLRSPLQLIQTYASMLSDAGPTNELQQQFVNGIHRGVRKMSELINSLLDLAKIEAGVGMEKQLCYLDQIIAQVVRRLEGVAREKGLSLASSVPPVLPPVEANVYRMDQVVSNLIDNAIKYTLEGSVVIRAFTEGNQVVVCVTDTGIGLTPQEQTELFNKFYRAGNELTVNIEGTGLGLAIVKSIVKQYRGDVWVQSTWQEGSTFAFSLPISGQ